MPARRLLFVRAPRKATLAPIYVALLSLLSLGLLAFVVALWPDDSPTSASVPAEGRGAVTASRSSDREMRSSRDAQGQRSRLHWM